MKAWTYSQVPTTRRAAAVSPIRKSSLIAEHCPLYRTPEYGPDIETNLCPKYITRMEQVAASASAWSSRGKLKLPPAGLVAGQRTKTMIR
jgi:hypothetical protein